MAGTSPAMTTNGGSEFRACAFVDKTGHDGHVFRGIAEQQAPHEPYGFRVGPTGRVKATA